MTLRLVHFLFQKTLSMTTFTIMTLYNNKNAVLRTVTHDTYAVFWISIIVSKSQVKQRIDPQTFIVKMLIISIAENHSIYIKRKEGARRLAGGETERESVCERQRVAEKWR